ncbi:MAG: S8 family serine peptidase [Thermoleophilia bacterium]|nr:S8 family serine peptidase [Thermoleophilia bacterium]
MSPTPRRFVSRAAISAVLLAAVLTPPASAALSSSALSPRLAELARPALRAAPPAAQADRLGLARSGAGSLQRTGAAVLVNVRFERGAIARLDALKHAGARVVAPSRPYQTVTVAVRPADLQALATVPDVAAVTASLTPMIRGAAGTAVGGAGTCEGGEVISEGLAQLRVDDARQQFGLRGKGTTVGILSDSFDTATEAASGSGPVATHAQRDIEGNDLPGPAGTCSGQQIATNVLSDLPGGSDEGRAMLQIVHDLAPHAGLAFATAFEGELAFAQSIERLAQPLAAGGAGAGVVADDVAYFEEPFYQDGPVAAAIGKVTAAGTAYMTSAGNDNVFEGSNEIGSWEAPGFRDMSCPAAVVTAMKGAETHCMDFDPGGPSDGTFAIELEPESGFILDLQWAEPWFGVEADLDAFLLDDENNLLEFAVEDNIATQRPVELMQWENEGTTSEEVRLVINRCAGDCNSAANAAAKPRLKFVLLEQGSGISAVEFPESSAGDVVGPTVYGHAGSASAITLGAIPYSNSSAAEPYTSRGPATHYFGPVAGTSPAAALGSPEVVAKPDLAATDCGATTFFAQIFAGAWRFCGTSASAPHAAAVAALMTQGAPGAGNEEVRDSLSASAVPVGAFGPEAVGAGLLDAVAALQDLGAAPTADDPPSVVVPPLTPVGPNVQPPSPQPPLAAPSTGFRKKPGAVVRTGSPPVRLVFRFGSNQAGVTFLCKVDRGNLRVCGARFARRYGVGRHTVRVKARNREGTVDRTPAVFRFRVERRR